MHASRIRLSWGLLRLRALFSSLVWDRSIKVLAYNFTIIVIAVHRQVLSPRRESERKGDCGKLEPRTKRDAFCPFSLDPGIPFCCTHLQGRENHKRGLIKETLQLPLDWVTLRCPFLWPTALEEQRGGLKRAKSKGPNVHGSSSSREMITGIHTRIHKSLGVNHG
jgi:hypothetical protein